MHRPPLFIAKMLGVIFANRQGCHQATDISSMLEWLNVLFTKLPFVSIAHFKSKMTRDYE